MHEAEVLSARALCDPADVKEYVGIDEADDDYDNLLVRLVNAASEAIYRVTEREFVVDGSNPLTRTFDVFGSYADGFLYVGDLNGAPTSVVIKDDDDATVQTLTVNTDVVLYPRVRATWQPVSRLRFRNLDQKLRSMDYIEVTGNYGFPSIPEDIRQAAVVTAALWFARDVQKFSETFSLQEDRVELPRVLPAQVFDTARQYQAVIR